MTLDKWIHFKSSSVSEKKDIDSILTELSRKVSQKVTFVNNANEPIHRWFKFPAGFSASLVRNSINIFRITSKDTILDPFTGSGTVNVEAKRLGITSVGVEAHPLVAKIAQIKTYWEFEPKELYTHVTSIINDIERKLNSKRILHDYEDQIMKSPKLLLKVYPPETLARLYFIRDYITHTNIDDHIRDFLLLALLGILREVTDVDVGWPYILPKKKKRIAKPVMEAFRERVLLMYHDLKEVKEQVQNPAMAEIYNFDSRFLAKIINENSIDFIFTSPPYLNNYDYADRTRLELYFLGWCTSWRDITEKIRRRLMIAATTQVQRSKMRNIKLSGLIPPEVTDELNEKISQLAQEREKRSGKKDYDLMVLGYFNDISRILSQMYAVLKPKKYAVIIVGDSAPYGVYIPTHEYIAKISKFVGFSDYRILLLRERGKRWKAIKGIRRHNIDLGEYMVVLKK
ncbi:DNA methyltransferase [Thermococcus gammatolerans]|nr:DNA methyltransferase [Thermococcus gammatolerans]